MPQISTAPEPPAAAEESPLVVETQPDVMQGSPLQAPELYYGRDQAPVQAVPSEPVTIAEGGDVTLNFVNAEIREVVDVVLGQTLGVTYFIDPRVAGTVTMRTARPLPRHAVVGALEDVLAMNGAALVQSGDGFKVIPLSEATTAPAVVHDGMAPARLDRGFSLHIIPLDYASVETLQTVTEPFVPPGRTVRVDPLRNLFIFAGTDSEAADFAELVSLFDVDWMSNKSFGLFPLHNASAQAVASELERIFARGEAGDGEEVSAAVDIVPIDRLNAILVIASRNAYLDDARDWVERLDRGIEADRRQLYVYYLQNGRATELASVLGSALAVPTVTGQQNPASPRLAPGLEQMELSGSPTMEPYPPMGTTIVDGVPYPPVDMGAQAPAFGQTGLSALAGATSPTASSLPETARIVADPRNNALLIYATAAEYRIIEAALKRLDIVPLQVLIEATIAEVTLNDALKYGLEWFFNAGDSTFTFRTADPPVATPTPGAGLILSQFPGFSYVLAADDVKVVLNALSQITDLKVISSPQLLVLDNEPARLQVGDQVPIAVRSSISVIDPEAPVVNEIEYRDTGVILDIIPRVNASGLVVLDIIQEVSDVVVRPGVTATTTTVTPTIAQRRIASTVAINSGETVALGGLIRDNRTESVSGIPILSDIPLLGNLFKTTTDNVQRTELLVLLTPRVVRDRQDARTVTDELRSRLRALTPLPGLVH
jgi:general secretion pathway protein D